MILSLRDAAILTRALSAFVYVGMKCSPVSEIAFCRCVEFSPGVSVSTEWQRRTSTFVRSTKEASGDGDSGENRVGEVKSKRRLC